VVSAPSAAHTAARDGVDTRDALHRHAMCGPPLWLYQALEGILHTALETSQIEKQNVIDVGCPTVVAG